MQVELWATLVSQVLVTGAAGLVIVRLPRHPVGWLLVAFAVLSFLQGLTGHLAGYGLLQRPGSIVGAAGLASFSEASQRPLIGLALALLLVFPDGRLLSRRWRVVAVAVAVVFPLWFVAHLLTPGGLIEDPFVGVPNPFGVAALGDSRLFFLQRVFLPMAGVLAAAVAASVWLRVRRSRGDERQQLKVVGLAFLGVLLGLLGLLVTGLVAPSAMSTAGTVFAVFLWTLLPLAVVVAMSRYRLYDIDLLINRTVVYGLLSLVLLAAYTAAVLVVGRIVTAWGWTSPGTVAIATLAAAGVAGPGRRRIQREVDRRFARRAYDAVRLIDTFTLQWRDRPQPPAAVLETLSAALRDPTMQITYWLRDRGTYADVQGTPVPAPARGPGRSVTTVSHGEQPVVALSHDSRLDREPALLAAVTQAALLVLENARLHAEVSAELAEVRRSRARIVEAADAERQRVERDLHDGAQQRLVALALRMKLEQRRASAAHQPIQDDLVNVAVHELHAAVEELRELARGIAPESLTEEGLGAALDAVAARLPTPVVITASDRRLPPALERTLYYVACEAITNAVKHAGARTVTVNVAIHGRTVRLTVADDGCGGADATKGSGLRGLTDRVDAIGGTLQLHSPAHAGTTLTVEVPCNS